MTVMNMCIGYLIIHRNYYLKLKLSYFLLKQYRTKIIRKLID